MGYLRGLGDCGDCLTYDDSGNCISTDTSGCGASSTTISPFPTTSTPVVAGTPLSTSTPSASTSSGSNSALTNLESNLALAWTKIAGNEIAPQTTITSANGTTISTPAGQTANLASVLSGASLLSTSSLSSLSAYLPWILVGGAALMLIPALTGRK